MLPNRLGLLFCRLLTVTAIEPINTSLRVDHLLRASVERVAHVADSHFNLRHNRAGLKRVAAAAGNVAGLVVWMNSLFHDPLALGRRLKTILEFFQLFKLMIKTC